MAQGTAKDPRPAHGRVSRSSGRPHPPGATTAIMSPDEPVCYRTGVIAPSLPSDPVIFGGAGGSCLPLPPVLALSLTTGCPTYPPDSPRLLPFPCCYRSPPLLPFSPTRTPPPPLAPWPGDRPGTRLSVPTAKPLAPFHSSRHPLAAFRHSGQQTAPSLPPGPVTLSPWGGGSAALFTSTMPPSLPRGPVSEPPPTPTARHTHPPACAMMPACDSASNTCSSGVKPRWRAPPLITPPIDGLHTSVWAGAISLTSNHTPNRSPPISQVPGLPHNTSWAMHCRETLQNQPPPKGFRPDPLPPPRVASRTLPSWYSCKVRPKGRRL